MSSSSSEQQSTTTLTAEDQIPMQSSTPTTVSATPSKPTRKPRKPKQKLSDQLPSNIPLSGRNLALVSMISPESRQKCDVYGFKIWDFAATAEDADRLVKRYHQIAPNFDIYVASVGEWLPWLWDPLKVKNIQYEEKILTDMVNAHIERAEVSRLKWEEEKNKKVNQIRYDATNDGLQKRLQEKEHILGLKYKIIQLQQLIDNRQNELKDLQSRFDTEYSEEEKTNASSYNFPDVDVEPMMFAFLGADNETIQPENNEIENDNDVKINEVDENEGNIINASRGENWLNSSSSS